jgi:hypothetical protein
VEDRHQQAAADTQSSDAATYGRNDKKARNEHNRK